MDFFKSILVILSLLMIISPNSTQEIYSTSNEAYDNLKYLYTLINEHENYTEPNQALLTKIYNYMIENHPEAIIDYNLDENIDPDTFRTPFEMIINQGYSSEIHKIITEDNYILTAWRIYKIINQSTPIILQHGLLDSSFTWILNSGQESLAFFLADLGYDVWLTNNRGNRYSQEHVYWTPNQNYDQFWAFSYDEMAKYDVPANIQYVLNETSANKLHYIGHSEGTTQMFGAIANDPSIQDKLESFVGLGPVAFLTSNESSPLAFLIKTGIASLLMTEFSDINYEAIIVPTNVYSPGLGYICNGLDNLCVDLIEAICGFTNPIHFNASRMSVMGSHEPGGTSLQNMKHWAQTASDSNFQMYDYGTPEKNLAAYNSTTPPLYNISNWGEFYTPIYLVQGTADRFSTYSDLQEIISYFPNNSVQVDIISGYNHLDYAWSDTAYVDIYPQIVDFFNSIEAQVQVIKEESTTKKIPKSLPKEKRSSEEKGVLAEQLVY